MAHEKPLGGKAVTPLDIRNAAIVSLGRAGMHREARWLAGLSPVKPAEATSLGLLTGVAWRTALTMADHQVDRKRADTYRDVADLLSRLMHALVAPCPAAA